MGPKTAFVLVACVACVAACSLVVDTDGLAGGAGGPSDADAADDLGAAADGRSDAAAEDADAGTGADSGARLDAGFCTGSELFCDDFDDGGSDPTTRWEDVGLGAGPFTFDTVNFVSAPRSLRVELLAGTGSRETFIEKRVATTSSDVTIAFDIRIDTPSSQDFGAITYASIVLLPASGAGHGLALSQYGSAEPALAYWPAGGTAVRESLVPPMAFDKWQRLAFHVVLDGSPSVSLSLDGTTAAVAALNSFSLATVGVRLGVDTAEAKMTLNVRYDNVAITTQ